MHHCCSSSYCCLRRRLELDLPFGAVGAFGQLLCHWDLHWSHWDIHFVLNFFAFFSLEVEDFSSVYKSRRAVHLGPL